MAAITVGLGQPHTAMGTDGSTLKHGGGTEE